MNALTEQAAYDAGHKHRTQQHPRQSTKPRKKPDKRPDEQRWPWRGHANKPQAELLELAEAGKMTGSLCRVHDLNHPAAGNVDLGALMADPDTASGPWSSSYWQPASVPWRIRRFLAGLLVARLILEPNPDDLERAHKFHEWHPYRITPPGRAALHESRNRTGKPQPPSSAGELG